MRAHRLNYALDAIRRALNAIEAEHPGGVPAPAWYPDLCVVLMELEDERDEQPTPTPALVERVARAMFECRYGPGNEALWDAEKHRFKRYARAAIDAMRGAGDE